MVEIGGKPILWHIMKIYAAHGVQEFVICLGYRGYMIKEYFANYYLHACDVTFDFTSGNGHAMQVHQSATEPWKVTLVDTGETTNTGGRLKRVMTYVGDEDFLFTYGDGVTDLDIRATIESHRSHGAAATVTAVQPGGRFGALSLEGDEVRGFREKPMEDGGWINGGFFVLSPRAVDSSPVTRRRGRRSRCTSWPSGASCAPTATTGSGTRWTPCATATTCRICGPRARRRGRSGRRPRLLDGPARAADRAHRVQGRLAGAVAG